MAIAIGRAETAEQRDACRGIRLQVFVGEQNVPPERELDEWEESCAHYLANVGREAVATARLRFETDVAHIERVAVLPEWRGRGIGEALMRHLMAEARRARCARMEVGSQIQALPFYEKLGFQAYGDLYEDAGIPHRHMRAA